MIILIILGILLVVSLVAIVVILAKNGSVDIPAFAVLVITIALLFAGGFAIDAVVCEKHDKAYIEMNSQYEVLMYRLENQKDHVLEDTELYTSIVEYNTTVRREQKLVESKWVGLFHDKSIAKCKGIDLSVFNKEVQNAEDKG